MDEIINKLRRKEYDGLTMGDIFVLGLTGENIDDYLRYARHNKKLGSNNVSMTKEDEIKELPKVNKVLSMKLNN